MNLVTDFGFEMLVFLLFYILLLLVLSALDHVRVLLITLILHISFLFYYVGHSISNETNYYCSKTAELIHMKLSGHKVGNLAMTSDQLFNHIL
jgi:hypothetical protein